MPGLHVRGATGVVRDAAVVVMAMTPDELRAYRRAWMARARAERPRKGPYQHPSALRMDAVAEAVWARHAAPWYYDTGIRVVAEHRAVTL